MRANDAKPRLGLFKFSGTSSCHFPAVHDHYSHSIGRSTNRWHLKFLELARGETLGKEAKTVEACKSNASLHYQVIRSLLTLGLQ
jgi:hypothetical protein